MPKRLLRLVPLLAVAALLAGCVRVDLGITVKSDGSGTLSLLAAVDQQMLSLVQQSGQAAADPYTELTRLPPSQLPPGTKIERYQQDGFVGAQLTFPFAAGDDVAHTLEQTFAQVARSARTELAPTATPAAGGAAGATGGFFDGGTGPLQDFVLRKQSDGGWRFQATVPTQIPLGQAQGLNPAMVKALFKNASFVVRITLPGEVVRTNADERHGSELVWTIDPLGQPRTLTALTTGNSGTANPGVVAGLLALTAVLVGAGAWFAHRHGGV